MSNFVFEEKTFNLEDVYIATLIFGTQVVQKTILAKSEVDAIETIEMYYDEPETMALAKLNDMVELLDSIQDEFNPVIVMEMKPNNKGELSLETTRFKDKNIEEVQKEYAEKEAVFFNKESLIGILDLVLSSLQEKTEALLLSDAYLV